MSFPSFITVHLPSSSRQQSSPHNPSLPTSRKAAKRKFSDTESNASSDFTMESSPTPCRTNLGPQALTSHVSNMLDSIKDMRKDIRRISDQQDNAVETLDEIQRLTTRIGIVEDKVMRVDRTVSDAMMRVEGAMTTMANRILAVNFNTLARAENSRLKVGDEKAELSPLNNIETNQAIPYFPTTPRAISKLSRNLLQALLQELGAPMMGRSSRTMRERVRLVVGLPSSIDIDLSLRGEKDGFGGGGRFGNGFDGGWDDDFASY
ncbi:hypothetical protein FKW77_007787 [Venturia effusa]|uniref:Uncharacterized protein n=1 Tax=Venturia effusa TaxID=50376 RepID=A0A517KWV3_9PEZI|nr:hypothetical protein FKW77_007787 [Venturia effusa]